MSFSTVSLEDLKKAGVKKKWLVFKAEKIANLANRLTTDMGVSSQITDLYARINDIYACYEPGSHMILDAFLLTPSLTLWKISSTREFDIAILPEMRVTHGDGVQLSHPTLGYELWLSGNVDYAVIGYEIDKGRDNYRRLLGPHGSRRHAFEIASGCLFLVEAKHQSGDEESLTRHIPEAVSQAIAVLKIANLPEVQFCLSNGQTWIFFIWKSKNNTLT
ncbi:hypothetical protein EDB92DRAFT_1968910 [Lactarius akahatsu]|uniref:Uncharacterized protein n=1 Tax=Lactarius akahatsu TaxID=416441 RepID=A0AAD4LMA5_9AGAM|nr:hypothetical protein EDB92DRAFT_1968910 [Lactarius akahatsu]